MICDLHVRGLGSRLVIAITVVLLGLAAPASGALATLAYYDFSTGYGSSDTHLTSVAGNVTTGSGIVDYGITAERLYVLAPSQGDNAPDAIRSQNYFSFIVTPSGGATVLNLEGGTLLLNTQFSGPSGQSRFSVRSSVDGFTTDLIGPDRSTAAGNTQTSLAFGTTFNNLSQVEFRLYTWSKNAQPTTATYFDNITLTGVEPVPEPTHYALAGFGLLVAGIGGVRRFLTRRNH